MAKVACAQALAQVAMLIAAERGKEKENFCLTMAIIAQVEGEFLAHGFGVLLTKSTVNCHISNNMVGSVLLARGYCWGLYSYGMYGQTISYLDIP
jgi:hypothetical protein